MKRFFTSLFAWAGMAAGFLFSGGAAQAAIADYAGSYAANLASLETPAGGGDPVEAFYGRLELTVNAKGTATGTLKTRAGKSYSISTKVQESGSTLIANDAQQQNNVGAAKIRGTSVFAINFSLTIKADGSITVSGMNGNPGDANAMFFVAGSFKFLSFTGKPGNTPTWVGNYTLALLPPADAPETVPAGAGFASLTVNSVGKLLYSGKLGDGTKFTGSASPSAGAVYSIYSIPPGYAAGGYFSAELDLDQRGALSEPAIWNKVAKSSDKSYPAGFSTEPIVVIQPWLVPAKKAYPIVASLGFGSSKNFAVDFSGEGLIDTDFTTSLPDTARITGLANLQAVAGGASAPAENNSKDWNKLWSVKLNPLTGVFAGKQTLKRTVDGKATTTIADVEGVMSLADALSTEPFAYGQYRVSNVTGLVSFAGPLVNNPAVATAGDYTVKIDETSATDVSAPLSGSPMTHRNPPVRPKGSPTDGQVVKFTISEDLQTLTFNGQVLKYIGPGLGGRVYQKVVVPTGLGKPGGQFAVSIAVDAATGNVTYLNGFTQFITATLSSSRTQATTFEVLAPASTNITKL